MEFDVSDKVGFIGKPHVKRGYYPVQLLGAEVFADKEGNPVEGKFGRQIIMSFGVYVPDPKSGAPTEPLTFKPDGSADEVDVVLSKFVYHQYKDKTGELRTAVTPNSQITQIFKALGWVFDATAKLKVADYVGKWGIANVDDYEFDNKKTQKKEVASGIKEIKSYDGGKIPEDLRIVEMPSKFESKGEATSKEIDKKPAETVESLEAQKKAMDEMLADKSLTKEGHKKVIAQLDAKIEALKKGK
jgi:hypothetical protein